jgi:hypothetical protein
MPRILSGAPELVEGAQSKGALRFCSRQSR